MKIEKIQEEFNLKLGIRDNLTIIKSEMEKLEEDDKVKQYKHLKTYYDFNKDLENKKDEEILFSIIDNAILELPLPECYFCFGKDFKAGIKKNGEYYLLPKDGVYKKLRPLVNVGVYKDFENPNIVKIIPEKEIKEFEEKYLIIRPGEFDPEEEYIRLRRNVVQDELSKNDTKVLEKKPRK